MKIDSSRILRVAVPGLVAAAALHMSGAANAAEKMAAPVAPASGAGDVVATVGATSITATQLNEAAASQLQKLKQQEYDIKKRVLDDLITTTILANEAAARGISVEELTRTEIDSKAPAVTTEQVQQMYDANKGRFGDKPEADVKTMIEGSLKQQSVNQRRQEFIAGLRSKAGVKVMMAVPRMEVNIAADDPVKGPKDAPVTIVEFSDFQ